MMLRWRIWLTARASAMKRETICGFDRVLPVEHLDGGRLADERVHGAVDGAEPALAQLRLDPVFADHRPRREVRVARGQEIVGDQELPVLRTRGHVLRELFRAGGTRGHRSIESTPHGSARAIADEPAARSRRCMKKCFLDVQKRRDRTARDASVDYRAIMAGPKRMTKPSCSPTLGRSSRSSTWMAPSNAPPKAMPPLESTATDQPS